MTLEERIIKLEVLLEAQETKTQELHDSILYHMDKEEKERKEIMEKLQDIREARLGDRKFIGGIIFAVSSLWAIGIVVFNYFLKHG